MKADSQAASDLAGRYLALLKSAVLNELYLENEARVLYVFSQLIVGQPIDAAVVREIGPRAPDLVEGLRRAREEGRPWWNLSIRDPKTGATRIANLRNVCDFTHTMIGRKRLDNLEHCLDVIRMDRISGDLIETGVLRGGATVFMRGYLVAHGMDDRVVWVADSFAGLPKPTLPEDYGYDFSAEQVPVLAVSLEEVQDVFRRYGLLDARVKFLKGWFRDTLPAAPIDRLALLRLDGDLYESTMDALSALYEKLELGGYLIVDDYGDFEPCRRAVEDYRARHGVTEPINRIDWAGVYWRKERQVRGLGS